MIEKRIQLLQQLIVELMEQMDETKKQINPNDMNISEIDHVKPQFQYDLSHVKREENPKERKRYLKYLQKHYDKRFMEKIIPLMEQLPISDGSRFYKKLEVSIGIIADEFLFHSYNGVADFHYITGENYQNYVDEIDIFLVSTTWKGLNKEWKGLGNPNIRKPRQKLYEIIRFFQTAGIQTIFYSKEDPVNYHVFIDIAQQCDYIFTTAEEKVESYKKDCQTSNVYVLPFGVNPLIHNPIGFRKFPKEKEVIFAGSWYNKYPERQIDTRSVFDGVIQSKYPLKIVDRNFHLKLEQYFFPKEYVKFISPAIAHSELQKFHKLFNWSMNLNSVKYSPTMFANRVYELQALGNVVLSNYNVGINNIFPNVMMVHQSSEVKSILHSFTEEELYKQQIFGIRKVMSKHTTFQRLSEMLGKVGYLNRRQEEGYVAVVVPEINENIMEMFEKQTYQYKQLIVLENFNEQVKNSFDMIAFFNEKYVYGDFYLEDMVNAFKYTDSDYITKDAYYNGKQLLKGIEHDYVTQMNDKERTLFWSSSFTADELLYMKGKISLENGYSIDRFEWNQKQSSIKKQRVKQYKLAVIVPVFNNGDHLLHKCFNSLLRSTIFHDMEIILVDDGSTDQYTPKIVRRIANQYSNVKTYFFSEGGSGSASRPRNKGFELSTAPYITYLDPDNEAINDGYYHLYKEIKSNKYDIVIGNMVKLANEMTHFNYYKTLTYFNHHHVINENMAKFLIVTQFKAMSIQALVVKRQLISDHSIQMVEGAAGQDTLFFQELFLHAKSVKAINKDIHIYYAAVAGSIVNSVSQKFLEKYLLLERERVNVYKKHGLLEAYVEKRFEYYFKNWYLEKLKRISPQEKHGAIAILIEIFKLYEDILITQDPDMLRFSLLAKQKRYDDIWNELIANNESEWISM